MKNLCPNCEKETDVDLVKEKESYEIRGETIEVDAKYFQCRECNEEYENTRDHDALETAYRKYRTHHHMLQPETIREWRKRYGLTQRELSKLLGWGGATLSRFENGALQGEAHEKVLRLAMEPSNLLKLLEDTPDAVGETKRKKLISELHAVEEESCSFKILFEERFGGYDPDINSGYQKFSLSKLFNIILFLCRDGQLITKLNKLLFYVDFKHFKDYTVSITGARYIHLPHGPVPDQYRFYCAELEREGRLITGEVQINDFIGENCVSQVEPDLSVFSDTELKVLTEIKDYFKGYNSSQIREFSHKEYAYVKTNENDVISYEYAKRLKI